VSLTNDALERVKEISTNNPALAATDDSRPKLFPGR